jgi:2-polyprenyl-3-methyl-5-hydroxy-6-metoxy-1,4-benzoquinol methylase
MSQNKYYTEFALRYKDEIISSGDPSIWTSDIINNGPKSVTMKIRIDTLKEIIKEHFSREYKVFDIGCGFGRQSFLLANEGFKITGVDTNSDFIGIAKEIFKRHSLEGNFHCIEPNGKLADDRFHQIVLLDVLEHIPPFKRRKFIISIWTVCWPESTLIISLPIIKPPLRLLITNFVKYFLSSLLINKEHPYPIPDENSLKRILGKRFKISGIVIHGDTAFYICKS